jgi:uncharacterized protein (DUF4415 family)
MSEKNTGKTVNFEIDLENPPPFTTEELDQLERLKAMRDEDVDLTDIPSQAGKPSWRPGLYGAGVSEVRRTALREGLLLLDDDVVDLFRENGDTSPQKMNAVLREYAEMRRKTA